LVPKYTRPEMGLIWSDEHRYQLWLQVEIAAAEAWAEAGQIPTQAVEDLRRSRFEVRRIRELEAETQHETIAFVRAVAESAGEGARYLHRGLTSSDVIDTALSLQMLEAVDLLLLDVESLMSTLRDLALEHRDTLMMGRTHGVHAEPTTFGFKMAVFFEDMRRRRDRLGQVRSELAVGKLAGAVGTHSNVPPEVERQALARLGLAPGRAETQVIQRDRHASYVFELALICSCLDKIATEIRSLQRTEIGEAREPFAEGQQGSSAMPHKRNPVLSERISGLARVVRGYVVPALEDIPLWHERDISNSSAERVVLPDASILCDYLLDLCNRVLSGLTIFPKRMLENLEMSHGVVFSQRLLAALTDRGLSRQQAYDIVQRDSLRALDLGLSLREAAGADREVLSLINGNELEDLFDYRYFTRNLGETFSRLEET